MPYVEGFGTWPFGEEWLWEAMATSYLPLLDVLERDAPLTLSLTPVLCDQLEAPGVAERFVAFLRDVRARDARARHRGLPRAAPDACRELERSARPTTSAPRSASRRSAATCRALVAARDLDARRPRTRCCRCWRPTPGVRLQVRDRHRRRTARAPRRRGAAASGCPSARTRRGWTRCSRRPASTRPASTSPTSWVAGARPAAAAAHGRRAAARADRPARHRARVERRRLPGARRLPRLPPPHRPPPPRVGQRRRALRPRPRRRRRRAPTPPTSSPGSRARLRGRRALRLRARHRAARPLVVRGSGVAARGDRRGRSRRAWRCVRSTTRSPPPRPRPAAGEPRA